MPEHLRALVVILFLATVVFTMARRPALDLMPSADYKRRRNLWFALTLLVFISGNFWIYAAIAALVLLVAGRREHNPLALFFMLLFLMPASPIPVPGFGVINYLIDLDHIRLLSLSVLLPAAFALRQAPDTLPFGRTWPDRFLLASLVLMNLLYLRETSLTDTLRQSLYLFLDIFLPYYVASRALKELSHFKDALLSFVIATMLLALIATFESVRHWLLYNALTYVLGIHMDMTSYLSRGGALRASATTGQAIALGYVMSVGIGLYLYVQGCVRSTLQRCLGALLLAAGLFVPLSRGPWVGTGVIIVVFIATGRGAVKRLAMLAMAGLLSLPLLAVVPGGEKVIDMLPYIGNLEKDNITYRERLLDNSLIVIKRNLWFGSFDFRKTPEMQSMVQGQGIIDIVNTYLNQALRFGVVGLGLFVAFFACAVLSVRKTLRTFTDKDDEMCRLGRSLAATLLGIMVTIFTVSSITFIPVVYWSITGVAVAYVQMVRRHKLAHTADIVRAGLPAR